MLKNTTIGYTVYPDTYVFHSNCIIYTPDSYDATKSYPLIIFGHGSGEAGTDINVLYQQGLPAALKAGFVPPFDCVIACPQASSYGINPAWLPEMLKELKGLYSIDATRIYLTGLSAGGYMCYGAVLDVTSTLGSLFAGMVVLSGATQDANMANISWWKANPVPVLAIVGANDSSYVGQNQAITAAINSQVTNLATFQLNPGQGHGGWIPIYNNTWGGTDIWKWMQAHVLGTVPPAIFQSAAFSKSFTRNNCPINSTPSSVTYSIPAGKYSSTISQANADQQAAADMAANGQNYANQTGTCTPIVSSKTIQSIVITYSDGTTQTLP